MKRYLTILTAVVVFVAMARDYTPEEIKNPNIANRYDYIADPGNAVSAATKERVNQRLYNLREQTSAEVAVAVVPSIGDMPIEDFAEKVFTGWGLGKSDKDNGVLIVIALEQKRARIQTGYGVEGALPDISAKKIIDRAIVGNMRQGDLDEAVDQSTEMVAQVLSDPTVAEELKSSRGDAWESGGKTLDKDIIWNFVLFVILVVTFISIAMFFIDLNNSRGKDRYTKAMIWHRHRTAYWLLAICSLGGGLIFALLAEWLYKRTRNKPIKCHVCGTNMVKLGEDEDNEKLDSAQDLEERLNTVDYDVWVCPKCGSVEKYPFKVEQTKYTECPHCHTIAMCEVCDHTIYPATTRRNGEGEKIYECQYCHNQTRKKYVIPKKDDGSAAALAAGAILGSMGRGGGGGGGFGGGFGGGMTGGGGASGGW